MSLYQRMYDVFHPVNTEGTVALIAIILWLIISFVCRKEFGGFFSALKSLGITVLIIAIMWWIHPAFAIAAIVSAVLQTAGIIKGNWPYFLIALAMIAAGIWKYIL